MCWNNSFEAKPQNEKGPMKTAALLVLAVCAAGPPALAAPRASLNYSMSVESANGGGGRAASANYTTISSLGQIGGLSTAPAPTNTFRQGYAGQLFEVTSLSASAAPAFVPETGTAQLVGVAMLDDATTTLLSGADIHWTVLSGPIAGVSAAGVATASIVPTNLSATIQGDYLGATAAVNLMVVDSDPDNFGAYAGDGLPDFWQVQYFGLDSSNAAPNADPDNDGRNNMMEFIEGTDPTSSASAFYLRIAAVPGQPTEKNLVFGPRLDGRDYTLQFETNLAAGSFAALTGGAPADNGTERTVTDLNADGITKFYRVSIGLSAPVMLAPGRQGNAFSFLLPTVAGFNYLVEYKTSLSEANWTQLQWVLGDGQVQTVTDSGATLATRLYRVHR
jgi:hypothetical protein